MKERIINEILMQMEPHVNTEQLRILETVIIKALYYVEVQKKETELSTEMDDNVYLLQVYEMNVKKDGLSDKTVRAYMGAMRNMLCVTDKNIRISQRWISSITWTCMPVRVIQPGPSIMRDAFFRQYSHGSVSMGLSILTRLKLYQLRKNVNHL